MVARGHVTVGCKCLGPGGVTLVAPEDDNGAVIDLRQRRRAEIRNIIAMAIPVVITTSSRALMDIADYVMITRLHSNEAQAAMLPAQLIMWSYIVIGFGTQSR